MYDLITIEQAVIGFVAVTVAVLIERTAGASLLAWSQITLLIGLGLNEPYWSLAREAFAGADWMFPFTQHIGITGKIDYESHWFVLVPKTLMLLGAAGWLWCLWRAEEEG